MRKNYDIELALALIIVDLDDLVKLIRSQDKRLEQNLKNYDFSGSETWTYESAPTPMQIQSWI